MQFTNLWERSKETPKILYWNLGVHIYNQRVFAGRETQLTILGEDCPKFKWEQIADLTDLTLNLVYVNHEALAADINRYQQQPLIMAEGANLIPIGIVGKRRIFAALTIRRVPK